MTGQDKTGIETNISWQPIGYLEAVDHRSYSENKVEATYQQLLRHLDKDMPITTSLDVDAVIADFVTPLVPRLNRAFGKQFPDQYGMKFPEDPHKMTQDQQYAILADGPSLEKFNIKYDQYMSIYGPMWKLEPESIPALMTEKAMYNLLANPALNVEILTGRPVDLIPPLEKWFGKNYTEARVPKITTTDGTNKGKLDFAEFKIFIDDTVKPAKIGDRFLLLVTQPWNDGWETDNKNSVRVRDANEAAFLMQAATTKLVNELGIKSLVRLADTQREMTSRSRMIP